MINISTLKRFVSLAAFAAAFMLVSGNFSEINAQRDPFQKPGFMKPKAVVVVKPKPVKIDKPMMNYAAAGDRGPDRVFQTSSRECGRKRNCHAKGNERSDAE